MSQHYLVKRPSNTSRNFTVAKQNFHPGALKFMRTLPERDAFMITILF